MFGITSNESITGEWLTVVAILCVAGAVKLMDDAVDVMADRQLDRPNWAIRLDRAVTPYSLALLAVAAMADTGTAIPLFCAAYAWGMAGQWQERMPSGLTAMTEGLIALGLSVWFYGWLRTATALALVVAVDLWDDVRDEPGKSKIENTVMAVSLGLLVLAIAPVVGLAGLLAAVIFTGPLSGPGKWRRREPGIKSVDKDS